MAAVRNFVRLASNARAVLPTSDTAFALEVSPVDTDMRNSESHSNGHSCWLHKTLVLCNQCRLYGLAMAGLVALVVGLSWQCT